MKMILAGSTIALGFLAFSPAMAQGVYVGPDGVGVDTGVRLHRSHRDWDRDRYYRQREDRNYEGRSAYDQYDRDR